MLVCCVQAGSNISGDFVQLREVPAGIGRSRVDPGLAQKFRSFAQDKPAPDSTPRTLGYEIYSDGTGKQRKLGEAWVSIDACWGSVEVELLTKQVSLEEIEDSMGLLAQRVFTDDTLESLFISLDPEFAYFAEVLLRLGFVWVSDKYFAAQGGAVMCLNRRSFCRMRPWGNSG